MTGETQSMTEIVERTDIPPQTKYRLREELQTLQLKLDIAIGERDEARGRLTPLALANGELQGEVDRLKRESARYERMVLEMQAQMTKTNATLSEIEREPWDREPTLGDRRTMGEPPAQDANEVPHES